MANIILLFYLLFHIVSLFYLTKVSLGCTANKTRFPIVTHVIYSTNIEEKTYLIAEAEFFCLQLSIWQRMKKDGFICEALFA